MTDAPEYVDDDIAYLTGTGLGNLIPAELAKRDLPGVCDGAVMPGAETAFDQCGGECPGLWWVRVGSLFPSLTFPQPDIVSHERRPVILAQQYEVGLVRAIELPDNGEAADIETLTASARLQHADMRALLKVICDYFRAHDTPFVIGNYTPYGPQGFCVGGSWTVTASAKGR